MLPSLDPIAFEILCKLGSRDQSDREGRRGASRHPNLDGRRSRKPETSRHQMQRKKLALSLRLQRQDPIEGTFDSI